MEWLEIKVLAEEPCVEAVAGLFHMLGADGVVIEDPGAVRAAIARNEWDAYEFPEEFLASTKVIVKAYLPRERGISRTELEKIKICSGETAEVYLSVVKEEDWASSWKQYYHTTRVGDKITVRPAWEEYKGQEGELVVAIDPGMAFGTGTHPTTCQCIRLLEKVLKGGERVIDIGTGSGILAITAAKLGADSVWACDVDEVAVKAAKDNAVLNGVESRIEIVKQNFCCYQGEPGDLVLANITAGVILELFPNIVGHLKDRGCLIAAGINKEQWPEIEQAMFKHGMSIELLDFLDEWVAVLARKGEI